jgi:hypothetical protein
MAELGGEDRDGERGRSYCVESAIAERLLTSLGEKQRGVTVVGVFHVLYNSSSMDLLSETLRCQ